MDYSNVLEVDDCDDGHNTSEPEFGGDRNRVMGNKEVHDDFIL